MIKGTTPTRRIKQQIKAEYEKAVISFRNPHKCTIVEKVNPTNKDNVFYVDFSQEELSSLGAGIIDFEIQYFYEENTKSNIEISGRLPLYDSFSQGKVTGTGGIDDETIYSAKVFGDTVVVTNGTGENGATFTPITSVQDSTLTLEWTNDKELENPTPVSITAPQGEKGTNGTDGYTPIKDVDYFDGAKGDSFTYDDFTDEQLASLKGEKGDTGAKGEQGLKGEQGEQGIQGEKGDKGDTGEQGLKGDTGATGANGTDGIDGTNGTNGTDGQDGTDGYTPIKGTDYFTQSDIDEIVSIVVEQAIGDINSLLDTINGEVIE